MAVDADSRRRFCCMHLVREGELLVNEYPWPRAPSSIKQNNVACDLQAQRTYSEPP